MMYDTASNLQIPFLSSISKTRPLDLLSSNHILGLKIISIVSRKDGFLRAKCFNRFKEELKNLHKKSEVEVLDPFDEKARENAYKVLDFLLENTLFSDFYIYPDDEKAIAIDYSHPTKGAGKGLLILCDSNGGYSYYQTYDHKNTGYETKDYDDFCNELKKAFFEFEVSDTQSASTKSEGVRNSSSYYSSESHQNVA